MTIHYNVTGTKRKELVNLIANFTGCSPVYKGAPTFAYEVDHFTITRDGTLEFDDRADSEVIERLLEMLYDNSFIAESEDKQESESTGLTVEMPLEKVNVGNLTSLLDAKGGLIRKALGIDALPIEIGETTIKFPWFTELPEPDEAKAYTHLIAALCEMSRNQKRITAKEKAVDNEKYAFRCFLLRLGFIGTEYKAERKILLRNLTGSSAFKSGRKGGADDAVSE